MEWTHLSEVTDRIATGECWSGAKCRGPDGRLCLFTPLDGPPGCALNREPLSGPFTHEADEGHSDEEAIQVDW